MANTEFNNQGNSDEENQKKAFPYTITIIGYVFILLFLLITAPVVCPPIIKQHTYPVSADYTGKIGKNGSVVYVYSQNSKKATPIEALVEGNIVAVDNEDGDRDADCYYVDANNVADKTITLRDGKTVSYDLVHGRVWRKTPFIGYLCGILFYIWGVIADIIILLLGLIVTLFANKIRKDQKEAELRAEIRNERKLS